MSKVKRESYDEAEILAARVLEGKKEVPYEMATGMRELLENHSYEELWFLNQKVNKVPIKNIEYV
jgi:hypothetical protein